MGNEWAPWATEKKIINYLFFPFKKPLAIIN